MVGISPGFVSMDSNGLYISLFFSVVDKIGWYINRISLLWTILIVISTGFVGRGQYWVVYFTDVSCLDNISW